MMQEMCHMNIVLKPEFILGVICSSEPKAIWHHELKQITHTAEYSREIVDMFIFRCIRQCKHSILRLHYE